LDIYVNVLTITTLKNKNLTLRRPLLPLWPRGLNMTHSYRAWESGRPVGDCMTANIASAKISVAEKWSAAVVSRSVAV